MELPGKREKTLQFVPPHGEALTIDAPVFVETGDDAKDIGKDLGVPWKVFSELR